MKTLLAYLRKNVMRWLPGVFISAVAFGAVFFLIKFQGQDAKIDFSVIEPMTMIAAVVLTILSLVSKSMLWRTLLHNKPSFGQTFLIVNEGYLLNNLLPLKAGEIGRAVFMGKTTGLGTLHVLSTIVIERAFDVAVAAGLFLATFPLVLGAEDANKAMAAISLTGVVLVFALLYAMARYQEQVKKLVDRWGERWSFIKSFVAPKMVSFLRGLGVLTDTRQFLMSIFWVVVTWVIWVSVYYIVLLSLAPNAPLWWGVFVDSFLALGAAVPSAPAGLGVYEASLVGALSFFGIDLSVGLSYALAMHLLQFVVTGVFGLIGLIKEGRSFSVLFAELQRRDQAAPADDG
ncbi:MAG: flippase-like domain-containing protein [Anaerolineaceae bacterium]|nr:flippase-like domain-containing protein [Anaerolineaceae bacterium]